MTIHPNNFTIFSSTFDKGVPPRGWKIEPSEFEINIDGETDSCSKGVDLNFEFIGFGITGSVLSKGADSSGEFCTMF